MAVAHADFLPDLSIIRKQEGELALWLYFGRERFRWVSGGYCTREGEREILVRGFHRFRKFSTSFRPILVVFSKSPCFCETRSFPVLSSTARLGTPFFSGI